MKKVADLLKANILIFFGAILFLIYLNYLALNGGSLAVGIIATLISIYYVVIGILFIVIGKKINPMTRKVFEVISVCLFALLMFVVNIVSLVNIIQLLADGANITVGPTAWIILFFNIFAALALMGFYPVARFVKKNALMNVCVLISALFCLALLLNILFDFSGFPIDLGDIPFMYVAVYTLFGIYLFGTFKEEEPARLPEPKEEKAEEPAPEETPEEPEAEPEEPKEE